MQITKFGHSCVLLDDGQTKILFDPGLYSDLSTDLTVDAVVITHVHQDHLDMDQLQRVIKNGSPRIITNTEVQVELTKHSIEAEILEAGDSTTVNTFTISGQGNEHAIMHPDLPKFQNTGYLINDKIFHPGDSLFVPSTQIEILLLPVAAPWSKVSETLDYISTVKAKVNFPIHDGFITDGGAFHRFARMWCEKIDAEFIEPELKKQYEFSL